MKSLFVIKGRNCFYCGVLTQSAIERGEQDRMATRDHRIPRVKGGPNVLDNIEVACYFCNCAKSDMTEEEFRKSEILQIRFDEIHHGGPSVNFKKSSDAKRRKQIRYATMISRKKGKTVEEILAEWNVKEKSKISV